MFNVELLKVTLIVLQENVNVVNRLNSWDESWRILITFPLQFQCGKNFANQIWRDPRCGSNNDRIAIYRAKESSAKVHCFVSALKIASFYIIRSSRLRFTSFKSFRCIIEYTVAIIVTVIAISIFILYVLNTSHYQNMSLQFLKSMFTQSNNK